MNVARFLHKNSRDPSRGRGNLERETHIEALKGVSHPTKKKTSIMEVKSPDLHKTLGAERGDVVVVVVIVVVAAFA
ncbi:Hypothetical predicted protein [Octopus vulgaris]|uniref:Uncharacterized protein n=1 Tax=Octopus vulgaris TaxID=6645 RepID=A0AA36B862_OCTVU|nr:Hypothetical predicted protein [Octopus vulgaris]